MSAQAPKACKCLLEQAACHEYLAYRRSHAVADRRKYHLSASTRSVKVANRLARGSLQISRDRAAGAADALLRGSPFGAVREAVLFSDLSVCPLSAENSLSRSRCINTSACRSSRKRKHRTSILPPSSSTFPILFIFVCSEQ